MIATSHTLETSGPVKDLRDRLVRVDATGKLVRVRGEVDSHEQMSALSYLRRNTGDSFLAPLVVTTLL